MSGCTIITSKTKIRAEPFEKITKKTLILAFEANSAISQMALFCVFKLTVHNNYCVEEVLQCCSCSCCQVN